MFKRSTVEFLYAFVEYLFSGLAENSEIDVFDNAVFIEGIEYPCRAERSLDDPDRFLFSLAYQSQVFIMFGLDKGDGEAYTMGGHGHHPTIESYKAGHSHQTRGLLGV